MNKEGSICRHSRFESIINVYNMQGNIIRKNIPVNIIICPRILILQRFCYPDFNRKEIIRLTITVFNYENKEFGNIYLTHTIIECYESADKCFVNNETTYVIDCLPPLSCRCIVFDVCMRGAGEFISKAVLNKCFNGIPERIAASECRALLRK